MTLHAAYDPDNIFAKILRQEMPCVKVYEDDLALAFMDVFPQADGHTLVIPKAVTARNFLDLPSDRIGSYMQSVQLVCRAVETGLNPDGLILTQFNGAAAGQTVFHLHFHIIPAYKDRGLKRHAGGEMAQAEILEGHAKRIRAALP
ncbi:MAG: HIT family protein [Hyphomonas sp. TMED17]|nr:MAG: HIT family protein [Hyphomonas sp. TMED17]